ncbi:MAG: nitroreductase/quinone reductase family protein [Acidimicrobiia bacterium]|jgi:deazaflavin-dependent oxidoreductase (nitroreductase family)
MATTKPNPRFVRVLSSFHRTVVRCSGGRLLTGFKGQPMILLTTTGRKTGQPRTWPLTGLKVGDGWAVAASNGGHDHHPAWYLNLEADRQATVEAGRRKVPVRARITEGAERDDLYEQFVAYLDNYAQYEAATERVIPVVLLEPVAG